jgi:hypothetical protein
VIIVALTLTVAAVNAIEPLILKGIFDELTSGQRVRILRVTELWSRVAQFHPSGQDASFGSGGEFFRFGCATRRAA